MLDIVPDQPFHGTLSGTQTTAMVAFARAPAQVSRNKIMNNGLAMFGLAGPHQNGLANYGGMRNEQQMLNIPACWLQAPALQFRTPNGNQLVQRPANNAQWNLVGVSFAQRNTQVHELHYINVNGPNVHGSTNSNHRFFIQKLDNIANALDRHGILGPNARNPLNAHNVQNPQRPQHNWNVNLANTNINISNPAHTLAFGRQVVRKMRGNFPARPLQSPVLVTINQKSIPLYSYLKRAGDLTVGVNTIVAAFQAPQFNDQKGSNIALKYNLKIGQANHLLANASFQALRTPRNLRDTIVIGADVTHPGKGAAHGTPSVAGVVGSVDDEFMQFPGSMRLQRHKKEYIIELGDMVKERLIDWAERHNDRLPRRILFYRDGVSESQYDKLQSFEIPQIQKAFNWAQEFLQFKANGNTHQAFLDAARDPFPHPSNPTPGGQDRPRGVEEHFDDNTGYNTAFDLTYVVVGKRHHTRFYPSNPNDRNQTSSHGNVKPGLVVDRVITHPFLFDFYLQSHVPVAGTGRSAHYIVLQNNMAFTASELHSITHDFCYTYCRATKGVSYCAPAYYADRLCDRGRCYIYHFLINRIPLLPHSAQHPNGRFIRPKLTFGERGLQYHGFIKNTIRGQEYYRPPAVQVAGQPPPARKYGFARRNPWHPNLDGVMFYI